MSKGSGTPGAGSIRQRTDGRWEARVSMGTDSSTGKPISRSFYGKTKQQVSQQMTAVLNGLSRGLYLEPNKMTVSEWFDEWLSTFCVNRIKPLTYQSYQGIVRNHIVPAIGAAKIQEVKGIHIQQMYNTMTSAGLSGKTVKNVSSVLHKGFSIAIKQGIIAANPCDSAELPRMQRHEIEPLANEEIPLFLAAIDSSPMRNAYALCLFAGLREGECLGLSWAQVDFEKGRITICQQLQKEKTAGGKYYIAAYTKSDKPRTIEPPPIAFDYLRAEQTKQKENQVSAGTAWCNEDDLVFTNELGRHYAIFTFYKEFKKIAARIGRPNARPHDLRHTAATIAIAAGADIKSVQSMMGHSAASFTLNVYTHTSNQMMRDTAERIQRYYNGLTGHSENGGNIASDICLDAVLDALATLVEVRAATGHEAAQLIRQFRHS